jgi:hypothetical protein
MVYQDYAPGGRWGIVFGAPAQDAPMRITMPLATYSRHAEHWSGRIRHAVDEGNDQNDNQRQYALFS